MKKAFLLILLLIPLLYWYFFIKSPAYESCIQMMQPARNPITREVRFYGNPCQVPIGWEKIKESYQLPK